MDFTQSDRYEESVSIIKKNMAPYYKELNLVWDDEAKLSRYKECSLWVIKIKNTEVGFYMAYENEGMFYIAELHIDSNYRNKGYGAEALSKIREIAAEIGYEEIRVGAFKNSGALKLYEKFGFRKENETEYTHELVATT